MSELAQALFQAMARHGRPGDSRQMAGDAPPVPPQMMAEALANMAKGAGAGLAGMPVDLATTVMRPFGYDVEQPVGGSDWFGDLMGADTDSGSFMAGQFASPDPMDAARVASHAPELQNLIQAMTVFHGSPHKWDKVDLSKVGTGEGAQAYGHGFYAAENPRVAKEYQTTLSRYGELHFPDGSVEKVDEIFPLSRRIAANTLLKHGFDGTDARYAVGNYRADQFPDGVTPEKIREQIDDLLGSGAGSSGNLYELDLPDETIDKMLDWDSTLSKEHQEIAKDAFNDVINKETDYHKASALSRELGAVDLSDITGKGFYEILAQQYMDGTKIGPGAERASKALNEYGIPGIKYLDGTSRDTGKGTRNFVVFDESYIKPLTRNGQHIKE